MEEISLKNLLEILGYNPFELPDNKWNRTKNHVFKVRALFKLMFYTHLQISFPRHFDPDLGQYKIRDGKEYLPVRYSPKEILEYRVGDCSTYAHLFKALVESVGFKSRLVRLLHPDKIQGHWTTEVKVDGKWIFFDPMYLVCVRKDNKFYSAYEVMKNPKLYIDNILDIFKGISEETWLNLWGGIEIDGVNTYDLAEKEFLNRFYNEK